MEDDDKIRNANLTPARSPVEAEAAPGVHRFEEDQQQQQQDQELFRDVPRSGDGDLSLLVDTSIEFKGSFAAATADQLHHEQQHKDQEEEAEFWEHLFHDDMMPCSDRELSPSPSFDGGVGSPIDGTAAMEAWATTLAEILGLDDLIEGATGTVDGGGGATVAGTHAGDVESEPLDLELRL